MSYSTVTPRKMRVKMKVDQRNHFLLRNAVFLKENESSEHMAEDFI